MNKLRIHVIGVQVTAREMFRNDFADQFVSDFAQQVPQFGHNPYAHIGYDCGINCPRALTIHHDRIFASEARHYDGFMRRRQAS